MLVQRSGITDEEQKKRHLQKMLPGNYTHMLAIVVPATFNDTITRIQQYETELGRNSSAQGGPSQLQEWPMDIDAININAIPNKKKGKCFECRIEGHWAKDCFKKNINRASSSYKPWKKQGYQKKKSSKKPYTKDYKGKGRKWNKRIREAGIEEDPENKEDLDERELQVRGIVNNMDDDMKKHFYKALNEDFQ